MATVQQFIDIKVPVQAAYSQLMHFEDYPQFMEDVQTVQRLDDTHLHWTTMMANRPVEWDAEITEREPDRCIAWRNVSGPTNAGRVEFQPAGTDGSRIVFTLETQPEQVPGSMAGNSEDDIAQRLKTDLLRLRDFIESRGTSSGQIGASEATRDNSPAMADPQEGRGSPRNAPVPTSSYGAGAEGFDGTEEWGAPVTSATSHAAGQRNDSAGSSLPQPADNTPGLGATAAAVGAAGGTDAAAGARMAGGPATHGGGAPGGAATAGTTESPGATAAGGGSPAAGATAAGGTGMGGADVDAGAGDTRIVPEGTNTAASGTSTPGGKGISTGRNPS